MSFTLSNEIQPSAFAKVRSRVQSAVMAFVRLWIARRDERILLQAPAHQLQDIGLARADIRRAVRVGCR
jgi:uncharacterized protein YjiS (DUF1127 family)